MLPGIAQMKLIFPVNIWEARPHDNLSQRNLIIVDSDNPGNAASHTVSSTFELRRSSRPPCPRPSAPCLADHWRRPRW
jgi:hypothetical protein